MIEFDKIKYMRPDYELVQKSLNSLIKSMKDSKVYDEYLFYFKEIISIQNHIEEMYDYADIKNMRDSNDDYFAGEITFWNEYKPKFDLLFKPFYTLCINSKFKDQLRDIVPENFFNIIEIQTRITSDEILELQKIESNLKLEYRKIMREKVFFEGEEKTLSYISQFFSNNDRTVRKKAHDIVNDFYYQNQVNFDDILFNLINVRKDIANKLGFDNYSTYSLYKLRRFGYDYSDISKFRDAVVSYIVPLCRILNEWKKQELGIDHIEYYDTIYFKEMPELVFKEHELLINFGQSLKSIDSDLYEFYSEMLRNGYIDLDIRDGKVNFSITNYLTKSAMPVITGKFKNSYLDLQSLSHEFGHAYQKYNAGIKDKEYIVSSLLKYPTFDIAEMFSHAMELICMKSVNNFFSEEDYKKYCFLKIYNLVSMIPYFCLVDEFQEKVYAIDKLKKGDMRRCWLELSEKYHFNNNRGHINLESGGYFYRQSHIMLEPFYYIDYGLSYFGALAIFDGCDKDIDMFRNIGSVASYYPFKDIIERYNMPNPFDEACVKDLAKVLEGELLKYEVH